MTFTRIEPKDLSIELSRKLVEFCVDYVQSSHDSMLMPMQLLELAEQSALKKDILFQFWLLKDDRGLCGYALTEIMNGEKGQELYIRQAYISPNHRNNGAQELTIREMEEFARGLGCKFLVSATKRTPFDAYLRWMARVGFRPRSVDVEKPLTE